MDARLRGFTLVELLLALGVSALIAVAAHFAITTAIAGHQGLREEVLRLDELQRAMDIIEADLGAMLLRRNRSFQGGTEPILLGGNHHEPLLQFSRGGVANPAGLQRSDMQRVWYVLAGDALWRQHRWQLDVADPNVEAQSTLLLAGVRELQLEFLPRQFAQTPASLQPVTQPDFLPWTESWDSEHLRVGQTHPLPLALRLSLDIEGLGRIQRVFNLP